MSNNRVLLGMSGGVDSSAAAAILIEKGYNVIGVTLKLYDYDESNSKNNYGCRSLDLINDARLVCSNLKIPHYVLNLKESFNKYVITNFIDSYERGYTPNPCIRCNTFIKWGEMIKKADELDCQYIATGHYARIKRVNGKTVLLKAKDSSKDQSYALYGINKNILDRTLLPVGDFLKTEIRDIAQKYNFVNANRSESQEICFIPDNDYANFIKKKLDPDNKAFKSGLILNKKGDVLGKHKGYVNYTIGQRRGLGISSDSPLYVTKTIPEENIIVVGKKKDLLASCFKIIDTNWFINKNEIPQKVRAKIRYNHQPELATVNFTNTDTEIIFDTPQHAITPGQSAVLYDGEIVIGGGVIDKVIN